MPFEVPETKKRLPENRFEFTLDGETYDVPHMKYVSTEAMEAFEQDRTASGVILAADNDAARKALRSLDSDQLDALSEAWLEASGIKPGE